MALHYCGGAHCAWLPADHFYPGSLRAGETRCKRCNSAARKARRRADPVRLLQWKLYHAERRRGVGRAYPSLETIGAIWRRFHGRSAISGVSDQPLCIVRYDPSLPASSSNAVLVTASEARSLARKRLAFPAVVHQLLEWPSLVPQM